MTPAERGTAPWGVLAEFDTPARLLRAAEAVRDEGYARWDCHTPFPVHGLAAAMGMRDTRLPWVVLAAGVLGAGVAILMQMWMNAVDYPLNISGKPLFGLPSQIPIAFELTILFSAVTAFLGMFAFNRLPRFHHPAFSSERFRRATADRFFIVIEASDPKFDLERTSRLLRAAGSGAIELLEDR
jgi:hypothetical protein